MQPEAAPHAPSRLVVGRTACDCRLGCTVITRRVGIVDRQPPPPHECEIAGETDLKHDAPTNETAHLSGLAPNTGAVAQVTSHLACGTAWPSLKEIRDVISSSSCCWQITALSEVRLENSATLQPRNVLGSAAWRSPCSATSLSYPCPKSRWNIVFGRHPLVVHTQY